MKQLLILLLTLNDVKLLQMGWHMIWGTFRKGPISFWNNLSETLLAILRKDFNSSINLQMKTIMLIFLLPSKQQH